MNIVVHHNPDCGTSRNTVAIVEAAGYRQIIIIEYLKTGWTRPQLLALFAAADLTPRTALRTTKSPAVELGLMDPTVEDETILAAMLRHPVLVNRPIVCTPRGFASAARAKRSSISSIACRPVPWPKKTARR